VFADVAVEPPQPGEIECDTSEGTGPELTDDQRAVLELQERLGEDRFNALMALLQRHGVPTGVPLDRARSEQLGPVVEQLSVAALRRMAGGQGGTPVPLAKFLDQMKKVKERSPTQPVPPEPLAAGAVQEAIEDPRYTSVVEASEEPSQPSADPGGEGIHAQVLSVEARHATLVDHTPVSDDWSVEIARVRGDLVRNGKVYVDYRMTREAGGRLVVRNLNHLETVVTGIAPSEKKPGMQEAYLEVTHDQKFVFGGGELYYFAEQAELRYTFSAKRP